MNQQLLGQRMKQVVRRTVGEPYVGKRLKLRRLAAVLKTLDLQPHHILDAGAEDATFVYWLADRFPKASVLAVDIDRVAMSTCLEARPKRYSGRVTFEARTFADLEPASFDLITALDVLEHIEDDNAAVRDLFRALRPGGTMLVHVPRNQWTTRSGIVHRIADEDAWKVNAGHVRAGYSPEGIHALLTRHGFHVEDIEPWVGPYGTLAHDVYAKLETPMFMRALSIPVTDVCAWLDRQTPTENGNTVYARATRRD